MQGQQGSNPQPAVLETATLPVELCPCLVDLLDLLIRSFVNSLICQHCDQLTN